MLHNVVGILVALAVIALVWKLLKGIIKLVVIGVVVVLAIVFLSGHLG